jgi:hypothetical protein
MEISGYLHPGYAASLGESARPLHLPRSGGWLLERAIPGTEDVDAIGPYPLLCCALWSGLADDLTELGDRVVSVVLVTDPFGDFRPADLSAAFSHGLVPYKEHHVIDLEIPLSESACDHHRRNARKALGRLTVEAVEDAGSCLDVWCSLYAELVTRHRISGIAAFSRPSFAAQFEVPGLEAFRAVGPDGATVGMALWYCQGPVGYYHLGAYSPQGYQDKASYALFWAAAEHFRGRLRWLSLGAGAGARGDSSDGLTRFKRGWSPVHRPVYLGRHVASPERYRALSRGCPSDDLFPAYRFRLGHVA